MLYGQDKEINKTLSFLKRLEFSNAREYSKKLSPELRSNILFLTSLVEVNSYSIDNRGILKLLDSSSFKKIEDKGLGYLIKGYWELYINNHRTTALKHFRTGLELQKRNSPTELKKAFIVGVFKLKLLGYSLSNNSYLSYLSKYKSSSIDDFDLFWYHYYQIQLFLQTTDYDSNSHESPDFYLSHLDSIKNLGEFVKHHRFQFLTHKVQGDYFVKYDGAVALNHFEKVSNLLRDNKYDNSYRFRNKIDKAWALSKIGLLKNSIDTIHKAKKYLRFGNEMTNRLNYSFFLSEFFEEYGTCDSSLFYLRDLFKLRLKSNHENINQQISELEIALNTSEKEKKILEEQQKVRVNRNWLIAASLALLLGTGIAILLQKNTTKKRLLAEQEAILKQQRVENLLKEQELVSIDAMIAGQEKERQKVAGELHDDLGSLMATIKLHFDNAKLSKKDASLRHAQKLLEEAYQKVRSMAHSKNSGVMSDQGLLPAIKKMANTITETGALEVAIEDFGLGERMENSLELSIFRMVQELLANAIKHAEATKVNIQLTQHEDTLNIIVEDNGKGFDRSKLDKNKSGMGLTNIEKRVEHLEGNFTVDSIVGKGTAILIDIPV